MQEGNSCIFRGVYYLWWTQKAKAEVVLQINPEQDCSGNSELSIKKGFRRSNHNANSQLQSFHPPPVTLGKAKCLQAGLIAALTQWTDWMNRDVMKQFRRFKLRKVSDSKQTCLPIFKYCNAFWSNKIQRKKYKLDHLFLGRSWAELNLPYTFVKISPGYYIIHL